MPVPETLLVNGKIFQAAGPSGKDQEASFASGLLIGTDGTIKHVDTSPPGSEDDVTRAARARGAAVHDLGGRTVLPGFFDGHVHLLLLGLSLQKVDLAPCRDLDDIRRTIRAYAAAHPDAPRIFCKSWMHAMTPGGVHHGLLDDLDPRPIFVDTKDLHSTWCNQAGIDELDAALGLAAMADPAGGTIHRDAEGRLTGLFEEAAVFTLIWPWTARTATPAARAAALEHAVEALCAAGYVGMTDMAMDEDAWEGVVQLKARRPDLPARIAAYWLLRPSDDGAAVAAQVDRAAALAAQYSAAASPDLRVVGVKIVSDGIVDACTAALSEPYAHGGTGAEPVWTRAMLDAAVGRAAEAGLQVAIHAIGDLAVRNAVDALEASPGSLRRPRIEHLELASAGDAARLGRLGITASVQPVHADPAILRAWPRLVGEHRCGRAFAYREMADGGAALALGTDAPTAPHGLPGNCYVATTRRSAREPGFEAVVNPQFALGLCESVVAGSMGSAWSCYMEDRTGRIAEGLQADLAVLDMQWDKERLLEAKVVETWFSGRKVYSEDV